MRPSSGRIADSPRGRIVRNCATLGPFADSTAKPTAVFYVKTGSSRHEKDFWHFVQKTGCHAEHVQTLGENFLDAYQVTGAAQALDQLSTMACIREWHFALDVAPPRGGVGQSKPKEGKRPLSAREQERKERVEWLCADDAAVAAEKRGKAWHNMLRIVAKANDAIPMDEVFDALVMDYPQHVGQILKDVFPTGLPLLCPLSAIRAIQSRMEARSK